MAHAESNPLKNLGIEPQTIKLVVEAGGIEALKLFVDGHRKSMARALHPDKTNNRAAIERYTQLSASSYAVHNAPDMLVEQWAKVLRAKNKAAETQPQILMRGQSGTIRSLVDYTPELHQFWKPARYLLTSGDNLKLVTNDGSSLSYRKGLGVSNHAHVLKKTTLAEDIAAAKQHQKIIDIMQNDLGFSHITQEERLSAERHNREPYEGRKAILEVGDGGDMSLRYKNTEIAYSKLITDEDPGELLRRPGIYNLIVSPEEVVARRIEEVGITAKAGPILTVSMPSIVYSGEELPVQGAIAGFISPSYKEGLDKLRNSDIREEGIIPTAELLPGEAGAFYGSLTLRDNEIELLDDNYLSQIDKERISNSYYLASKPELLIARSGTATLFGTVALILPIE